MPEMRFPVWNLIFHSGIDDNFLLEKQLTCVNKNVIICVIKNAVWGYKMRAETYEKIRGFSGYIDTNTLLKHGITNRQIFSFVEEGILERVCHGYYWVTGREKPREYKEIEICLADPKAIICAESACFYWGLLQEKPDETAVATRREDRSSIKVNFPIRRHFVSDILYYKNYNIVATEYGKYNVSDLERSVCDCIRFRKSIASHTFDAIMEAYCDYEQAQYDRILEYAKRLNILKITKEILE